MRLSKTFIDQVQPPALKNGRTTQTFYRDAAMPGFGLRVTSGGSKAFIVEKRIHGRVKRITLGKYGNLTLEQARKEAQKLLGEIATGKDPDAEKRALAAKNVTLGEAFQAYLITRKDLKPGTVHDYTRAIETALPDWLNRRLVDISKDMVENRHRKLGEQSEARANNTMRVLRAIYNNAIDKYEDSEGRPVITVNPVERLSRNRAWYRVENRQSLIKPHQLKPWYEATMKLNQETTRDYLHFLLFTGLRRTEAATLTWQHVDMKDRSFTIPDTKNRDLHILPMSDFLEELLARRQAQADSEWVFASPVGKGYLSEPRTAIDRVCELSGVHFRLHDLRRTFITIAESLDIPAYALKRLLNHRMAGDVTAGYIVPNSERLREPMQRITNFIQQQINRD